jgi:hypothetical protein
MERILNYDPPPNLGNFATAFTIDPRSNLIIAGGV